MEQILIIEDDTDINNLIREALGKAGYDCRQAFSGTEGLLYFQTEPFSLVLLDLMLPGINGEELLGKLRAVANVPVIILSAKDSLDSKVGLLEAGAEDYITKPFEIEELLARVKVQLRRTETGPAANEFTHKSLILNLTDRTVRIKGEAVTFTKQEFKILELLMKHPNRVFSKQDFYDYAWDEDYIGEDKTINMHISNIRKKIKKVCEEEYIETVWGIGFKLAQ